MIPASSHLLAGLLILTVSTGRSQAAKPTTHGPSRSPNVVFFLVDDLGWSDVGCYGSRFYETPNIDALAEDGVRFTQAYAACHVCSPTRASILTGKYPARLRLTDWLAGRSPKQPWPRHWGRRVMPLRFSASGTSARIHPAP